MLTVKNSQAADGAAEFVEFITDRFDCYWLTTHCQGNTATALHYLSEYFDMATMTRLQTIKPTRWRTLKTVAIDLHSRFVWLDDYAITAERAVLERHGLSASLITVDLKQQNELMKIAENIE